MTDGQTPAEKRRTWRRRAEARPDELLDAALDEFIAKGFDAARIEDIAARAGVSKGAVYLYFPSKEALLRALIERKISPRLGQAVAMADAAMADPRAALRAIPKFIGVAIGDPRFVAIPFLVLSVANRFPELAEFYRDQVVSRGRMMVGAIIARGVAAGQLRPIDPDVAMRALVGPIMFEAIWAHGLKGESEIARSTAWIDAQIDLLLTGLETR